MKFLKFFSNIQEAVWYRSFLNPVINEIGTEGKLLDVGTGSGKLIQIVSKENGIDCIGVDTNADMIKEAEIKLKETNIKVLKIEVNQPLPFDDYSFNYITICSVLFHLKNEHINAMLKDAKRLLKDDGKIIVLTPTGNGNMLTLSKKYFALKDLSIYIWFNATRNRAKTWAKNNYLKQYATENNLQYTSKIVMDDFAKLEILK